MRTALIELLFVVLRDAECLAHDLNEGLGAHEIKVLLGGCKTGVALLRHRGRIGRDHQLAGLQGGEDCVAHRDLRGQVSSRRFTVFRDID